MFHLFNSWCPGLKQASVLWARGLPKYGRKNGGHEFALAILLWNRQKNRRNKATLIYYISFLHRLLFWKNPQLWMNATHHSTISPLIKHTKTLIIDRRVKKKKKKVWLMDWSTHVFPLVKWQLIFLLQGVEVVFTPNYSMYIRVEIP